MLIAIERKPYPHQPSMPHSLQHFQADRLIEHIRRQRVLSHPAMIPESGNMWLPFPSEFTFLLLLPTQLSPTPAPDPFPSSAPRFPPSPLFPPSIILLLSPLPPYPMLRFPILHLSSSCSSTFASIQRLGFPTVCWPQGLCKAIDSHTPSSPGPLLPP